MNAVIDVRLSIRIQFGKQFDKHLFVYTSCSYTPPGDLYTNTSVYEHLPKEVYTNKVDTERAPGVYEQVYTERAPLYTNTGCIRTPTARLYTNTVYEHRCSYTAGALVFVYRLCS